MLQPLVSIVMGTYNGQQFLDEQIESVIKQDYGNKELIVVDDCSTDETWQKLQQWQQKIAFMKVYRNEANLGYNKNFEKAIQLAAGDFISICDQDDVWLPQKISSTMAAFNDPDVVLAHCRSVRLEDGKLNYHKAKLHHHFGGNDTRKLFFFNQIMGHDMVFKKELISKIVPIPEGMSYDWWIAVVATCYGKVAAVHDFLVHHRIHTQNNFFSKTASSKKKELDLEETLQIFTGIPGLAPDKRNYLNNFLQLLHQHNQRNNSSFDWKLFGFLYKHRKIVFGHKRRFLPGLSYLKNAIKYAKLNYNGRGMSV